MPGMMVEPLEPVELAAMLGGQHVRGLTETQQHLLVAYCWGGSLEQIAGVLHLAPGTLRNRLGAIEDIILAPLGLARSEALTTQWFTIHLQCGMQCLSHAKMLCEKRCVYACG